jgi:hypothetical protein
MEGWRQSVAVAIDVHGGLLAPRTNADFTTYSGTTILRNMVIFDRTRTLLTL